MFKSNYKAKIPKIGEQDDLVVFYFKDQLLPKLLQFATHYNINPLANVDVCQVLYINYVSDYVNYVHCF